MKKVPKVWKMNAYFLFGFENLFGEVRSRMISDQVQVEKLGSLMKYDFKTFRTKVAIRKWNNLTEILLHQNPSI